MDFVWSLGASSWRVRRRELLHPATFTLALVGLSCTAGAPSERTSASAAPPALAAASAPSALATGQVTSSPSVSASAPPARDLPAGSIVPEVVARSAAPAPFVVLLHGYGGSGASIARHFGFATLAAQKRFIFIAPDGEPDAHNARFWAAGAACCDFGGKKPDHLGSLRKILDAARANPKVDPARVFVVGFSNGGFMAHRLACEVEGIRGIVSVAGAVSFDAASCKHAAEVIIQVHGDADPVVRYEGGRVLGKTSVEAHPGALAGITSWAKRRGCDAPAASGKPFDLDPELPGAETTPLTFACAPGTELLRVANGEHDIASNPTAMSQLLDRLILPPASP
jgi:polyhydroxybutyrate depolymerase